MTAPDTLPWGSPAARRLLTATVSASGLVFLDVSTVQVALPAIGAEFAAPLSGLQWTVGAYTLALAALILPAGALGDHVGLARMFRLGTVWFALASILCALAPTAATLVAARGLQGIGGALLTPASLALVQRAFGPHDRARAIGVWAALSGIAAAAGPVAGGWLVDVLSWRAIFWTNLPVAGVVLLAAGRGALAAVPAPRPQTGGGRFDVAGAALAGLGLGMVSAALIAAGEDGFTRPVVWGLGVGMLALIAFLGRQWRARQPLLPLTLFTSRQFSGANAATFAVYGGLSGLTFLLVLHLQVSLGYDARTAGAALAPISLVLLVLSPRIGQLAARIGPRWPMTLGPLVMAAGMLALAGVGPDARLLPNVLVPVTLAGVGLALTVTPLTATVLAAVPAQHTGVAAGVNNAVSRAAGLLVIAGLPAAVGLAGSDYTDPARLAGAYTAGVQLSAGLVAAGGLLAWVTVRERLYPSGD